MSWPATDHIVAASHSYMTSISEVDWDGTVALEYAAEHLFAAAQLLTSDRIPADHALRVSCEQHIFCAPGIPKALPASRWESVGRCALDMLR